MSNLSEDLRRETEKWLKKIKKLRLEEKNEKGKMFKKNIEAYISDSQYFLEKNDLIRAFEAVIWAWTFLEISQELDLIKSSS